MQVTPNMKETSSLHDKMIDGNWVLKCKRKRVSSGLGVSKEKENNSLGSDSTVSKSSAKKKLIEDVEISRSHRIKGHDGYYFECEVCDLGGNLLCCDCCPRTYHLECLNPPLKRAPPGRWQCPSCCEPKKDVKLLSHMETSLRRKRIKSNLRKLSVHDSPSLSGKISTVQKDKSINKGKTCLSVRAPSVENKPGYSQNEMSHTPKSRSPSSDSGSVDGISAIAGSSIQKNQDSSPISKASCHKEVHSTEDTLHMENASKGNGDLKWSERKRKKHILSLVQYTEISKKGRHKVIRVDKKKRFRSHKGKHAAISESLHKKASSNQQISASITKKESRVLKLSVKKHPEISTLDASPSAHGVDELGLNVDKKAKYHENFLEGVQQVDRILGCRVQASIVKPSCHTEAIKSAVSSAVTESVSDSEKIASVLPSCLVAPENGHELLKESNDGSQVQDRGDAKAVHAEEIDDALAERNTHQRTESDAKDDVMKAKELLKYEHITQVSCEFREASAVSVVNIADATDKVDSEENRDARTVSVDDHGNHPLPISHDSEVTNGKITAAQPDSGPKSRRSTQSVKDPGSKDGKSASYEFLVKWVGQSNIHNSWISESQLKYLAKRKLENYKGKYGTTLINICEEQWCEPQRIIAICMSKVGAKEALIKWCGMPYNECTWERLDEPVIEKSAHLVAEFEELESQTLEKDAWDVIPRVKVEFQEVASLTEQPKELQGGSLFTHQLEALNWLRKCWHKSKNVILADEMGLGKTVSACAFFSSLYLEFKAKLPCLVLVPLSTMPNWLAEFALWAPHLNVVEYHGHAKARSIIRQYEWHASEPDGSRKITTSYKFNVLLTTYEMVLADASHLRGVSWEVLMVDEGHRLKNSGSKLFGLLNTFSFNHRVLLTGTPLQNNIGEMYNLLNFLQPVSFPSLLAFEEKFNDLTTAEKVEELKKLVAPHMLRRLKKDAMQNIPPKTERLVPVELTSIQAEYYRAMLTKNYQILRNAAKGSAQQSMLNIVMQLRKVCNHPYLIPGTEPESGSVEFLQEMRIKASAKLTLLHSMLKILHKEGHRVLIFSQMTKLLDILEDYLVIEFGPRTFERVDGSVAVADRQAAIARFNQDKSRFVFLLSTRSCGLGINLATADTVIIYDSDFNPHADIQAMNRAHRIGQSNRLLVYRLVVRASVEERILQLAKKKLMLDQLFVNKSESQKEVEDILRWGTEELFNDCDSVNGQDLKEPSSSKVETVTDGEHKHRRRSGGLGDVYQDRCTDSCTKIMWDENAILKLLDRTNLQSSVSESVDGEMENDMLGSVKSLDWNDELNDENGGIELLPILAGDDCEQSTEAKEDNATNVTEENEWDKLLRLRWEQYQTEEEAALGRGKRLRKAISYMETFALVPSEVPGESANEEEEPEPVYTPAGRALKEKYAKLRARQKERIAQRHNPEVLHSVNNTELLRELQFPSVKEAQSLDANKHKDDVREDDSPVNLEDTKISQPFEPKRSNSTAKSGKSFKHGYKRNHSTHLDLSVNPSENLSPDVLLPNPHLQSGVAANPVPPSHLLPVLGLCAPNASQMNSMTRKSHSNRPQSEPEKRRMSSGMSEIPFPPPASSGPSNNLNIGEQEPTGEPSLFPELSIESNCLMKNVVQDNFFPLAPPSSGSFSSFQERLGLPNFDDNPFLAFPFPSNAMKLQTDHLPNLSLGTNIVGSSQDFPNIPLVPKFSQQLSNSLKQKHKMEELSPMLGLGQMHATQSSLPENHRRVLYNIMMRTQSVENKVLKKRLKLDTWSEDELDSLWIGVRRHGRGNWDAMLGDPKLKFSKNKTGHVLATRWIEEQQKIMDGPAFTVPKSAKPDFLGISDGMMNRALFGSKFVSIGSEPPKFHSHLTDIKLACGDRAPGFPFMEPTNHRGSLNDSFLPLPAWMPNKPGSSYSADFRVAPFHNPEKMNFPLEHSFKQNSMPGSSFRISNLVNEDEPSGSKKPKLPSFLDKSLNLLRDTHNNLQSIDPNMCMPPDLKKKQIFIGSPSDDDNAVGSSKADKLPHWLREAVGVRPSKPPEPHLPPTVSAIAQSVRMLYGEEKPTIPPFSIPGPPPSLPKDPRSRFKKKRKFDRMVTNSVTNVDHAASSSVPLAPPLLMTGVSNLTRTNPPSLSLNLNSPSSSSFDTQMKKSSPKLTSSPEVLALVASCAPSGSSTPAAPDMPDLTCLKHELPVPDNLETFQKCERGVVEDVEGIHGKQKVSMNSLSGCLEKLKDTEADRMSGDSSDTQSDESGANQTEVDGISSEDTVSDEQTSEHEP